MLPFRHRLLCCGATRSGKSTLAVRILGQMAGPKLVIDPQASELTTQLPGVHTTADPTGGSWPAAAETIRFVPGDPFDRDAYDRCYATVRERILARVWPSCAVLCDEGELVLPASGAPRAGAAVVYFGMKLSIAHITCSTRPKNLLVSCRANMTHGAFFVLPEADDRQAVASSIGVPLAQFEAAMAAVLARNQNGYLWWDQAARTLTPQALVL